MNARTAQRVMRRPSLSRSRSALAGRGTSRSSVSRTRWYTTATLGALAASLLAFSSCSGEDRDPVDPQPVSKIAGEPSSHGSSVSAQEPAEMMPEILDPRPRVYALHGAEDLTDEATVMLETLAAKIQVRDFIGLRELLSEDFQGHDPFAVDGSVGASEEVLAYGTVRRTAGVCTAPVLSADEFVQALEDKLGPWRRVLEAHITITKAEFLADQEPTWGKALIKLAFVGIDRHGGRHSLRSEGQAKVVQTEDREWLLETLRLEAAVTQAQERELFSEISRPARLAHEGIRYGDDGNDRDIWNGAAAGDVDGDGRFDVFVPSSIRNFLYRNRGDGAFDEEAESRGVLGPGGGTGTLFFDYDNDGDQDLAVAHVGWKSIDGLPMGQPLALYQNDGAGHFENVASRLGLDARLDAYSLTAFDYDADGWVDLFAACYGRLDDEPNDSWIEAKNGSPNALFRNLEGRGFEDTTRAAGLLDRRWSYGAAAADYDQDGDQDLYVVNSFGSNRLWRNAGDGTFVDVAPDLGLDERGLAQGARFGDLNNDGQLDLYVSSHDSNVGRRVISRVQESEKVGYSNSLTEFTTGNTCFFFQGADEVRIGGAETGAHSAHYAWGSVLTDFDLDGALDIYCVNGFVTGDLPHDT